MTMPAISAKAPGKTILFGEHAVVYGYPAIAVPIHAVHVKTIVQPAVETGLSMICFRNKGAEENVPLNELGSSHPIHAVVAQLRELIGQDLPPFILTITSTIPITAGLGSSAAVAVAAASGLSQFAGKKLTDTEINRIAYQSEIIQHGTPSGIDNSVIAFEKPIYFIKGKPLQTLTINKNIHLVLADSGERTLTKDVVSQVRKSREVDPEKFETIFSAIGQICRGAKAALECGDLAALGKFMTENHLHLQEIGVSSKKLDRLVNAAIGHGAYGAKLCGGGKGGFMVAICEEENQESIADQLRTFSPQVIETMVTKEG